MQFSIFSHQKHQTIANQVLCRRGVELISSLSLRAVAWLFNIQKQSEFMRQIRVRSARSRSLVASAHGARRAAGVRRGLILSCVAVSDLFSVAMGTVWLVGLAAALARARAERAACSFAAAAASGFHEYSLSLSLSWSHALKSPAPPPEQYAALFLLETSIFLPERQPAHTRRALSRLLPGRRARGVSQNARGPKPKTHPAEFLNIQGKMINLLTQNTSGKSVKFDILAPDLD